MTSVNQIWPNGSKAWTAAPVGKAPQLRERHMLPRNQNALQPHYVTRVILLEDKL